MAVKKSLQVLVESVVFKMLSEEEQQEIDMGSNDTGAGEATDSDSESELDLDFGEDSETSDAGGEEGLNLDDTSDEDLDTGDLETGSSGGGLDFVGGGGGGAGGFDGEESDFGSDDEPSEEEEDPAADGLQPGEIFIPDDPVATLIDQAIALLDETSNDQVIYNSIKASMQQYFPDFNDAAPVILELWNTEDPTLRAVARKLLLFIKGN